MPLSGAAGERSRKIALRYRALLKAAFSALVRGVRLPRDVVPETNSYLARSESAVRVVEKSGVFRLVSEPQLETPASLNIPIAPSFAKLLTEVDLRRVRQCKIRSAFFSSTTPAKAHAVVVQSGPCGNKLRMAASPVEPAAPLI